MAHVLEMRDTHKYVGTYRHLDSWHSIGQYKVIAEQTTDLNEELPEDEYDMCEPHRTIKFVEVQTDEPEHRSRIEQALHDTYTSWGCAHEYDCCGCRSYSARAEWLKDNLYMVTINSSRNY